jgi:hypothetical protein
MWIIKNTMNCIYFNRVNDHYLMTFHTLVSLDIKVASTIYRLLVYQSIHSDVHRNCIQDHAKPLSEHAMRFTKHCKCILRHAHRLPKHVNNNLASPVASPWGHLPWTMTINILINQCIGSQTTCLGSMFTCIPMSRETCMMFLETFTIYFCPWNISNVLVAVLGTCGYVLRVCECVLRYSLHVK